MGLATKTQIDEGDFTVVVSSAGPRKVRVAALSVTGGGGSAEIDALDDRVTAVEASVTALDSSVDTVVAAAAGSASSAAASASGAATSATNAASSATAASGSANAASASATAASTSSSAATTSANAAASSAGSASGSAASAATSATTATTKAGEAAASALAASGSADEAAASASTATTKATEASASASSAASSASTATTQASASSASAASASTSAGTATTKANEAAASASSAAASLAAVDSTVDSKLLIVSPIGGGTADDTASVQAAIDSAIAGNRTLFLRKGVVYTCTGLTVSGSLDIVGLGTLKQKASTSAHLLSVSGSNVLVDIRDITLDGDQTSQGAAITNALVKVTATGSRVSCFNVVFKRAAYHSIYWDADGDSATVDTLVIRACRFLDGREGNGAAYAAGDILVADLVNFIIDGNEFDSASAATVGRYAIATLANQTAVRQASQPQITNNRINRRGCDITQALGAIDLYMWADNAVVTGNVITNSTMAAIKAKHHNRSMLIANNVIDTVKSGSPGIAINGAAYVSIGTGTSIHDNVITGIAAAAAIAVEGIGTLGAGYPAACSIQNNKIWGCAAQGIKCDYMASVQITGNNINGGTIGVSVTTCDEFFFIAFNALTGQSSYAIYCDNNPATNSVASFDAQIIANIIAACAATYAVYCEGRNVSLRNNAFRACVNGALIGNASGLVTNANITGNEFIACSGTVAVSACGGMTALIATSNRWGGLSSALVQNSPVATTVSTGNNI